MHKAKWMALLPISVLLSAAAFADDTFSPNTTPSLAALIASSPYEPRWQLVYPVETMTHSAEWQQRYDNFDFQDNSALGRISRFRDLSFLTLAESRRSRLFLGVNNRGLIGLHFVGLADRRGKKEIAVFRMPYLRKKEPDSDLEQVVADSN